MAKSKKKNQTISDEDKQKAKDGCIKCWKKFIIFLDKFCELYFACSLIASATHNFYQLSIGEDANFTIKGFIYEFHLVFAVIMLFLSMRANKKVVFWFGFMEGTWSKALFLMYCASLILIESAGDDSGSWITILKYINGYICAFAAGI